MAACARTMLPPSPIPLAPSPPLAPLSGGYDGRVRENVEYMEELKVTRYTLYPSTMYPTIPQGDPLYPFNNWYMEGYSGVHGGAPFVLAPAMI